MAENLVNRLIGLLVTVGILAAIYFFAIKPILDTTNEAFDQVGGFSDGIGNTIQETFDEAGLDNFDADSIDISGGNENEKAQKILQCIKRVQPNTAKMQECVQKFE